jgi:hypothetical protein
MNKVTPESMGLFDPTELNVPTIELDLGDPQQKNTPMIRITPEDMGFVFFQEANNPIIPRTLYTPTITGRLLLASLYNLPMIDYPISITPNMLRDLLLYHTFFVHEYKALCILDNEGHEEYYTSEDVKEFSKFVNANTPCEVHFNPTLGKTDG